MNRMEAITWTLSVCAHLRLSQAKTLSELVAVTLHVGRVMLDRMALSAASAFVAVAAAVTEAAPSWG